MTSCNHEEQREEYLFGWMDEQEEALYLKHLQSCPHCQKAIEENNALSTLLAPPPLAFEEVSTVEHQELLQSVFGQVDESGDKDLRDFRSRWQGWWGSLQTWWAIPVMVTACLWLVLRPAHISEQLPPRKQTTTAKRAQPTKAVTTPQRQPPLRPVKVLAARKKTLPAFEFQMKQSVDFTMEETDKAGSKPSTTVDFSNDTLAVVATPSKTGKPKVQLQEKSMNLAPMHDEGSFLAVARKKPAKKSVQTHHNASTLSTVASIHNVTDNREPREISQHRVSLLQKIPHTGHRKLQASVPALPSETRGSLSIWIPGRGHSRRQMRRL